MGSHYLSWLDDEVEAAAEATGYQWKLIDDDWLHRSRSSGGYDSAPLCVMIHHTAGADNAQGEAEYMCYRADARPIANVCVDSKIAIVLAGGATNTNGSGQNSPMSFSRGTVAKDDMNRRAVGIEICNNGVGAPYPERQIDFLFELSNRINARCGNQPTDVCTHQHYAPDRKIDPAVASSVQGPWQPNSVNNSGSWSCNDLRDECQRRAAAPEPTSGPAVIHDEGDPMFIGEKNGRFYIGTGAGGHDVTDVIDHIFDMYNGSENPLRGFKEGRVVTNKEDVPSGAQVPKILGINVGS
jgi:hypothetical protein